MEKYFVGIHRGMSTSNSRLYLRRDNAVNWINTNPILASGEPGVETDTLRMKIGDGIHPWANLKYIAETQQGPYEFVIGGYTFLSERELRLDRVLWTEIDPTKTAFITLYSQSANARTAISSGVEVYSSEFNTNGRYTLIPPTGISFIFGYHYDVEFRDVTGKIIGQLKDMIYSPDDIEISLTNRRVISPYTFLIDIGWKGPDANCILSVVDSNENVVFSQNQNLSASLTEVSLIPDIDITRTVDSTPTAFSTGNYYIRILYDQINRLSLQTPVFFFGRFDIQNLIFDYANNKRLTLTFDNPNITSIYGLEIWETSTSIVDTSDSANRIYYNDNFRFSDIDVNDNTYNLELTDDPIFSYYYTAFVVFGDNSNVSYQTQYLRNLVVSSSTSIQNATDINLGLTSIADVPTFTPVVLPGLPVASAAPAGIDLNVYNIIQFPYTTSSNLSLIRYIAIPSQASGEESGIIRGSTITSLTSGARSYRVSFEEPFEFNNAYIFGVEYGGTYSFINTSLSLAKGVSPYTATISNIGYIDYSTLSIRINWNGPALTGHPGIYLLVKGLTDSVDTTIQITSSIANGPNYKTISLAENQVFVAGRSYQVRLSIVESYGDSVIASNSKVCDAEFLRIIKFDDKYTANLEINWAGYTGATGAITIFSDTALSTILGSATVNQPTEYITGTTTSLYTLPLKNTVITAATISGNNTVYSMTNTSNFVNGMTVAISGITGGTFTGYNGTGVILSIVASTSVTVAIKSTGTPTTFSSAKMFCLFLYGVNYTAKIQYNNSAIATFTLPYIVTNFTIEQFLIKNNGTPYITYSRVADRNITIFDEPRFSEINSTLYRTDTFRNDITTYPVGTLADPGTIAGLYYFCILRSNNQIIATTPSYQYIPMIMSYNPASVVITANGGLTFNAQRYIDNGTDINVLTSQPFQYVLYEDNPRNVAGSRLFFTSTDIVTRSIRDIAITFNDASTKLRLGHRYYLYLTSTFTYGDPETYIFPTSNPSAINYDYDNAGADRARIIVSWPAGVTNNTGRKINYSINWKGRSGIAGIVLYTPGGTVLSVNTAAGGTITEIPITLPSSNSALTTNAVSGSLTLASSPEINDVIAAYINFPGDVRGPDTNTDNANIVYTASIITITNTQYYLKGSDGYYYLDITFTVTGFPIENIPATVQYDGESDTTAAYGSPFRRRPTGFTGGGNIISIRLPRNITSTATIALQRPDGQYTSTTYTNGTFQFSAYSATFINQSGPGSARITFTLGTISYVGIKIREFSPLNTETTPARSWKYYPARSAGVNTIYLTNDEFVIGRYYKFQVKIWNSNSVSLIPPTAAPGIGAADVFINGNVQLQYTPIGYDIIVMAGQSNMAGQDDGISYNTNSATVYENKPSGYIAPYEGVNADGQFYYPQYAKSNGTSFYSKIVNDERKVPIMDRNGHAVQMCNFKTSVNTDRASFITGDFDVINAHAPFAGYVTTGGYPGVSLGYDFAKYYATSTKLASNRQVFVVFAPWVGTGFSTSSTQNWSPGGDFYERMTNATNTISDYNSYQLPERIPSVAPWNPSTTYGTGAQVLYNNDSTYVSDQANNTNHAPRLSGSDSWWTPIETISPSVVSKTTGSNGLAYYNTSPPYLGALISKTINNENFQLIVDNFKFVVFENDTKTSGLHPNNNGNIAGDVGRDEAFNRASFMAMLKDEIDGKSTFNYMYGYDYNDYTFNSLIPIINKIHKNNLKLRFHILFYNANIPAWMKGGSSYNPATAMTKKQGLYALMRHCYVVVKWVSTNYPGLVIQYDVTNEHSYSWDPNANPPGPLDGTQVYQTGRNQSEWFKDIDYIYACLVGARMADSKAVLHICEDVKFNYGTGSNTNFRNNVVNPIMTNGLFSRAKSATQSSSKIVDGIAIQVHLNVENYIPGDAAKNPTQANLDRSLDGYWGSNSMNGSIYNDIRAYNTDYGLKFMCTELDIGLGSPAANIDAGNTYTLGAAFETHFGIGSAGLTNFEICQARMYVKVYDMIKRLINANISLPYLGLWSRGDDSSWRQKTTTSPPYSSRATLFDKSFTGTYSESNPRYNYSTTAVYTGSERSEYYPTRTRMKPAFTQLITAMQTSPIAVTPESNYTCNRVVAFLWEQGENGSSTGGAYNTWTKSVENMLNNFINDVPRGCSPKYQPFTFVLGQLDFCWVGTESTYTVTNQIDLFNTATTPAVTNPPTIRPYIVGTASSLGLVSIDRDGPSSIGTTLGQTRIHQSARSERLLGLRFFNAYASAINATTINPLPRSLEKGSVTVPVLFNYNTTSGILSFDSTSNSSIIQNNPVGYMVSISVPSGASSVVYNAIFTEYSTTFFSPTRVALPYTSQVAPGTSIAIVWRNGTSYSTASVRVYGSSYSYSDTDSLYIDDLAGPGSSQLTLNQKVINADINTFLKFIINATITTNTSSYTNNVIIDIKSVSLYNNYVAAYSKPAYLFTGTSTVFPTIAGLFLNDIEMWPTTFSATNNKPGAHQFINWIHYPSDGVGALDRNSVFDDGRTLANNTLILVGLIDPDNIWISGLANFLGSAGSFGGVNYKYVGENTRSGFLLPFFGTRGNNVWTSTDPSNGLLYSYLIYKTELYFFASECRLNTITAASPQNCALAAQQFAGISSSMYPGNSSSNPYSILNPTGPSLTQYTGTGNDKFLFFYNTGSRFIVTLKNIRASKTYIISYYFSVMEGYVPSNNQSYENANRTPTGNLSMYLSNPLPIRLYTVSPLGNAAASSSWGTIGQNIVFGPEPANPPSATTNLTYSYMHPSSTTKWNGGWRKLSFRFTTGATAISNSTAYLQFGPLPTTRLSNAAVSEFIDTSFNFAGFQISVAN